MPLEERPASSFVDLDGVVANDGTVSISILVLLATLLDRPLEKCFVPVKTELVHWVDFDEVVEDEEEGGSNSRALSELLSGFINPSHSDLSRI
jgi:hypothetical protein